MTYPPLESLVPHRPPMALLDTMEHWETDAAVCAVTIRTGAPFVSDGGVPAAVFLEYMAQTVAGWAGYGALRDHAKVRIGYLLGAREFDIRVPSAAVGDRLEVHIRRLWGDDMIGSFECEVRRSGDVLATATLSVFQGDIDKAAP